jgi:hypothetical protein
MAEWLYWQSPMHCSVRRHSQRILNKERTPRREPDSLRILSRYKKGTRSRHLGGRPEIPWRGRAGQLERAVILATGG